MNIAEVKLKIDASQPSHIDLIRLMVAINDIQRANRCMIADIVPPPNVPVIGFDKDSRGYNLYFVRLVCGHLKEGLNAFRKLVQDPIARKIILNWEGEKKRVYEVLCKASDPNDPQCFFKKELADLRDDACFHYPYEKFQNQITNDSKEGLPAIIYAGETYGETYYRYADDLIARIIFKTANGTEDGFKALIAQVRDLQRDLTIFVDAYLSDSGLIDG
ncbi:hypothetical protein FBR05_04100 [Deltaproteobacteria bacterium PRO3]|nr:hypothetical protein [Deltaproteobacteria bacterium PRO3]